MHAMCFVLSVPLVCASDTLYHALVFGHTVTAPAATRVSAAECIRSMGYCERRLSAWRWCRCCNAIRLLSLVTASSRRVHMCPLTQAIATTPSRALEQRSTPSSASELKCVKLISRCCRYAPRLSLMDRCTPLALASHCDVTSFTHTNLKRINTSIT